MDTTTPAAAAGSTGIATSGTFVDVAVPGDVVLAVVLVDDGAEVVAVNLVGEAVTVVDGRAVEAVELVEVEAVELVEDVGLDAVTGLEEAVGRVEAGAVVDGVVVVGALVGDDVDEGVGVVEVPVVGCGARVGALLSPRGLGPPAAPRIRTSLAPVVLTATTPDGADRPSTTAPATDPSRTGTCTPEIRTSRWLGSLPGASEGPATATDADAELSTLTPATRRPRTPAPTFVPVTVTPASTPVATTPDTVTASGRSSPVRSVVTSTAAGARVPATSMSRTLTPVASSTRTAGCPAGGASFTELPAAVVTTTGCDGDPASAPSITTVRLIGLVPVSSTRVPGARSRSASACTDIGSAADRPEPVPFADAQTVRGDSAAEAAAGTATALTAAASTTPQVAAA